MRLINKSLTEELYDNLKESVNVYANQGNTTITADQSGVSISDGNNVITVDGEATVEVHNDTMPVQIPDTENIEPEMGVEEPVEDTPTDEPVEEPTDEEMPIDDEEMNEEVLEKKDEESEEAQNNSKIEEADGYNQSQNIEIYQNPEFDYKITDITELDNVNSGDVRAIDMQSILNDLNESLGAKFGTDNWGVLSFFQTRCGKDHKTGEAYGSAILDIGIKESAKAPALNTVLTVEVKGNGMLKECVVRNARYHKKIDRFCGKTFNPVAQLESAIVDLINNRGELVQYNEEVSTLNARKPRVPQKDIHCDDAPKDERVAKAEDRHSKRVKSFEKRFKSTKTFKVEKEPDQKNTKGKEIKESFEDNKLFWASDIKVGDKVPTDGKFDVEVIYLDQAKDYAVFKRESEYQPYVAAWAPEFYNGHISWGQGHYFDDMDNAINYVKGLTESFDPNEENNMDSIRNAVKNNPNQGSILFRTYGLEDGREADVRYYPSSNSTEIEYYSKDDNGNWNADEAIDTLDDFNIDMTDDEADNIARKHLGLRESEDIETLPKDIQNFVKDVEAEDYSVYVSKRSDNSYDVEIETWDSSGGDFIIGISGSTAEELAKDLWDYSDNYNVDEEIEIELSAAKEYGLTTRQLVSAIEERDKMLDKLSDKMYEKYVSSRSTIGEMNESADVKIPKAVLKNLPPINMRKLNFCEDEIVVVYKPDGTVTYKGMEDYNPYKRENWCRDEVNKVWYLDHNGDIYVEVGLDIDNINESVDTKTYEGTVKVSKENFNLAQDLYSAESGNGEDDFYIGSCAFENGDTFTLSMACDKGNYFDNSTINDSEGNELAALDDCVDDFLSQTDSDIDFGDGTRYIIHYVITDNINEAIEFDDKTVKEMLTNGKTLEIGGKRNYTPSQFRVKNDKVEYKNKDVSFGWEQHPDSLDDIVKHFIKTQKDGFKVRVVEAEEVGLLDDEPIETTDPNKEDLIDDALDENNTDVAIFHRKPASVEAMRQAEANGITVNKSNYKVVGTKELSKEEFDRFANHLSSDEYAWLKEFSDINNTSGMFTCVEVKNKEDDSYSLLVDPQGYAYARYVAIKDNLGDEEELLDTDSDTETTEEAPEEEAE